ncbi:hypothetical protein EDM53_00250 [Rickettsiales endosymbiont of Peranema trichophorum]|uniref:hypothetical protein n=1 Tax=Rickettsiales endosymbiont of Peranema trichophorum TaxID=2486577 RepID=UPI001022B632|nr:hypothetical protein [Rickettsiales endosymbiont of Peranema trichophorum]RZI47766.1 hypothetical protein EDM53_00250 [Rickettsiales endosymbiont of Peranema trichophorum]
MIERGRGSKPSAKRGVVATWDVSVSKRPAVSERQGSPPQHKHPLDVLSELLNMLCIGTGEVCAAVACVGEQLVIATNSATKAPGDGGVTSLLERNRWCKSGKQ